MRLKQFGKNSLPFLLKNRSGDTYFRLENCSRIINLAGFKESVEAFTEKSINSEESRRFADEIIQNLLAFKQKIGRKHGKRLYPVILSNPEASERLAQLDVEKYGVAKVKFSGTREKPYYSTAKRFQVRAAETLSLPSEALETAQKMKGLNAGGTLDIIELEGAEFKPEALMDLTRRLIENQSLEFFTYNRIISLLRQLQEKLVWNSAQMPILRLHECTMTTFRPLYIHIKAYLTAPSTSANSAIRTTTPFPTCWK